MKLSKKDITDRIDYKEEKLKLSNFGINDYMLEPLIEVVEENNIKYLDLHRNNISNKGFLRLISNTHVTHLNVAYNNLSDSCLGALQLSTSLKEIELSDNNITCEAIDQFLSKETGNLEKITIRELGIDKKMNKHAQPTSMLPLSESIFHNKNKPIERYCRQGLYESKNI